MILTGQTQMLPMADGAEVTIYRVPAKGRRLGGLVLLQEIFGLTDHIKEQCERFSDQGLDVIAPSLFDRQAPGLTLSYLPEDFDRAIGLMKGHELSVAISDVQVCVDVLRDDGPVFLVGYCYGGSVSWAAANKVDGVNAAACYYGGMIPMLSALAPKCPTILHFGLLDDHIPVEGIETVSQSHDNATVHLYPAGHGFNSDRRADYHEESARLSFARTLEFFTKNG